MSSIPAHDHSTKRCLPAVSPNKTLQRSGTHKVLARGRLTSSSTKGALARTTCRRAAAELGRKATLGAAMTKRFKPEARLMVLPLLTVPPMGIIAAIFVQWRLRH